MSGATWPGPVSTGLLGRRSLAGQAPFLWSHAGVGGLLGQLAEPGG